MKNRLENCRYLLKIARRDGVRETLKILAARYLFDPLEAEPLYHARHLPMFETNEAVVRETEDQRTQTAQQLFDAAHTEASYPLLFEHDGKVMRYAFLPATRQSRGLAVMFHSWNAWLQLGPVRAWEDFDLLAPWDTFGWNRQGSWFWGEKGQDFVARIVQSLIARHRAPDKPLFCIGGSMGGFAALWHGMTAGCDGMYVQCPQIDLTTKIIEKGVDDKSNPFSYLTGGDLTDVPDLLDLAETSARLPPLYLIQTQFDPINPFAEHGFRLLDVYNRRKAWYGARIHPAIGHGADGTQREAAYFFSTICDKLPMSRLGV